MRKALDVLYAVSGAIAVLFLILIAVLTLAQVGSRLAGTQVPSADDIAGFCMAGCVFFGMTYTLRAGGHIRLLSLLTRIAPGPRRALEVLCAAAAALVVGTLAWNSLELMRVSHSIGEATLGLVPIPKWIPMSFMVAGQAIFLIAIVDELMRLLRGEKPLYALREEESASKIGSTAE